MNDFPVSHYMTQDVVTCSPDEPLLSVVKEIACQRFSCLIVVEDQSPVGIITERDLVEVLSETLEGITWDELSIKNFMTSPIISIPSDISMYDAIDISQKNGIRHLPVVDDEDHLIGLLTQTNIVSACYETLLN